jgi:O-antigen/teichoic acid export membrane protein
MNTSNFGSLISNYGSKIWGLISIFIFIPIYIHFLGIENYAVIGFYTLLLGIISFADAGMSSAIIKEFALDGSVSYKYSVLRRVENLYLLICLCVIVIVFLFSDTIAVKWLTADKIKSQDLSYYITLIGCGVTIQLLSSLYFGALFGLNEQIRANSFQITWNIFKAGIVILVLVYYKATLEVYFIWQIFCNIIYVLTLRFNVLTILKKDEEKLENFLDRIPSHILKYIGGMTLIAIISSVNSQADKIITSSFFSLKIFGYYNIASVISQMPVIVGSPLAMFIFPIFSKFSEQVNYDKLVISFKKISFLLNIIIIPSTFILILYTSEIINLWTGNTIDYVILPKLLLVIKFLALGSLFLAMQFPLFYLLLSKGKTMYTVIQGIFQIILGLPLLYFCVKYFDLESIGFPWILINLGSLIYLTIIVFKKYIIINYWLFFKKIIIIPILISVIITVFFYYLYLKVGVCFYLFATFSGILAFLSNIFYSNYKNKLKLSNISNLYDFPY